MPGAAAATALLVAMATGAAAAAQERSCSPFDPGPPTASLVPPGECVFGEEWAPAPLLQREAISHDTILLTFGLADAAKPLGLSTCACLLVQGGADAVVRPYTPVSTNAVVGRFDLMVKVYDDAQGGGALSRHLDALQVPPHPKPPLRARTEVNAWFARQIGDTVNVKHIPFNVKMQYPFGKKKLGMLVGGTGITPMLQVHRCHQAGRRPGPDAACCPQALHALLGTAGDDTEITLLDSNRQAKDILAREALDAWSAAHGRLSVVHTLTREPSGSDWPGLRGRIDRALIEEHMPPPGEDALIFVCGPPAMYDTLTGPRGDEELSGLLAEMGYEAAQVVKF